mmetsp:Transcript_2759/g.17202  ORF Transcript_2759/g.17202 Transcript_2759/m.17202 type:complete len:221 (+) Transcript_2759:1423-2085(+)
MQSLQPFGHRAICGRFRRCKPILTLPRQEAEASVLGDRYLAGQATKAKPIPQWTTAKFALALGLPSSCFPAPWFVLRPLIQENDPGSIDHVGLYTAWFEVSMYVLHFDHVVIHIPPDLKDCMVVVIGQAMLAHRLAFAGEAEVGPFVLLQPWMVLAFVEERAGEQPGQPRLNFHVFFHLLLGGWQRGFFVHDLGNSVLDESNAYREGRLNVAIGARLSST